MGKRIRIICNIFRKEREFENGDGLSIAQDGFAVLSVCGCGWVSFCRLGMSRTQNTVLGEGVPECCPGLGAGSFLRR